METETILSRWILAVPLLGAAVGALLILGLLGLQRRWLQRRTVYEFEIWIWDHRRSAARKIKLLLVRAWTPKGAELEAYWRAAKVVQARYGGRVLWWLTNSQGEPLLHEPRALDSLRNNPEMTRVITGQGKGLAAMTMVINHLISSDALVETNLPIDLKELEKYLNSKGWYGDLSKRLKVVDKPGDIGIWTEERKGYESN